MNLKQRINIEDTKLDIYDKFNLHHLDLHMAYDWNLNRGFNVYKQDIGNIKSVYIPFLYEKLFIRIIDK